MASPPTLENPMAGYDPNGITPQPQVAQAPATTGYEFDPKKEIDPMAGKFFDTVENDPRLSRSAKTRLQTGYLNGIDDIQAQRRKLEDERLRGIMDRQSIERNNMAFAEARQKQDAVARAAEQQKGVADTVKGIIASNLPPEEKRKQIAMYEIDNAATVYSDPAIKNTLDTAKSLIQVPAEQLYSTEDMRDKMEKGVPPEVVMGGDPVEIGYYERLAAAKEKETSDKLEDRKAAVKEHRSTIVELAKEPPSFLSEEKATEAGISRQDPNRLKYLTPESHQKGRILIGLLKGPAGLAEFEKLSDADKREAIMVAQRDAMMQALQKADAISNTDKEDVEADSLAFGTKKK
jgi:hypothetical protein